MHKHDVLEVIEQRKQKLSQNQSFDDGYKLCLAVEGGAMKGVVSLGMLMALRDLDLLDVFDCYVGVSAGNLNLVEILAGAHDPLKMYYDFAVKNKIIAKRRLFPGGKSMIDLDILMDYYHEFLEPLVPDLDKNYGSKLYFGVTDRHSMNGDLLSLSQTKDDMAKFLLAGATLPGLSTDLGHLEHYHFSDGVFYYPDPFMAAYDLGATHVLDLNTRSSSPVPNYTPKGMKYAFKVLDRIDENLDDLFRTRLHLYHQIFGGFTSGHFRFQHTQGFSIAVKAEQHQVRNLTLDQWIIFRGAYEGYSATVQQFAPGSGVIMSPVLLQK